MILFKKIFSSALLILLSELSFSGIKPQKIFEVVVKTVDGSMRAEVLTLNSAIQLKNDRTYWGFYHGNIFSKQGELQGKPLYGKYFRYDQGDNLLESGFFRNGLKTGTWKLLSPEGQLINVSEYENGLLNGVTVFYGNGKPERIEKYKEGKMISKPKYLNLSAKKKKESVLKIKFISKLIKCKKSKTAGKTDN